MFQNQTSISYDSLPACLTSRRYVSSPLCSSTTLVQESLCQIKIGESVKSLRYHVMETRLIMRNVVREKANRGKVEGNGGVRQERKEKWPHAELLCHSGCGRAVAGFDVDDIVEVGERRHVDRRHDLTPRELTRGRSIPTRESTL